MNNEGCTEISKAFVCDRSLSPDARVLGLVLATHADEQGGTRMCWQQEQLKAQTGMNDLEIENAKSELLEKDLIRRVSDPTELARFEISQKIFRPFSRSQRRGDAGRAGSNDLG